MANRKFFTGDIVVIVHDRYAHHMYHNGQITGTRRTRYASDTRPSLVAYHVACECGSSLTPTAIHMELVSTAPTSTVKDMRRTYFLRQAGIHGHPAYLQQQVDDTLALLTDKQRAVIVRRYGLADDAEAGLTLQAVADILDVSKQYVQQTEAISLQKLASSHLTGKQA